MSARKLVVESSFSGLLRKHLAVIRLEGAKVSFPELGTGQSWNPTSSEVVVDELMANGAVLEFARHDPKSPKVSFAVQYFVAHHLASHDPMAFEVRLTNPSPPGEVIAHGSFGPRIYGLTLLS